MCELCHGNPNCPVCRVEPLTETCPVCKGDGSRYVAMRTDDSDWRYVSFEQYRRLPESDAEAYSEGEDYYAYEEEVCERCGGTGEIERDCTPDTDRHEENRLKNELK